MFREAVLEIFENIWPMLFIFTIVLVSIRIVYLIERKEKIVVYRELFNLLFILYILCLFHVVTFQDVSWSTSNFIPFKEMFRYEIGSRLFFKNVVGNMLMFLPYGFFISKFIKTKKPLLIFLLILIASITIELTQLWIGRVFDVDDIILNIVGGTTGYLLYRLINYIGDRLSPILKKDIFYNILFLILIIICLLYLANIIRVGV